MMNIVEHIDMNPFLNPSNLYTVFKNYMFDPKRIWKLSPEELKNYQDKSFKKVVKYAYDVPLYRRKYKKKGIYPSDINKIDDIKKLPFISKDEIRKGYPNDILPFGINNGDKYIVCTGGTTGKPITLYVDIKTMSKSISLFLRDLKLYNLNSKKNRIVHLGNFSPNRIDLVMEQKFLSHLNFFYSKNNTLNLDVNNAIHKIMDKLNKFKPDLIISYPAIYQHLAYLKKKGYGKDLNPKYLMVGGAIVDDYTKSYVEDAFGCKLLNTYSSVEASGEIAIECPKNTWHIHSDFYHLETIDEGGNVVSPDKKGHMVITRLFTGGSPIIRYTGMDDWIKLSGHKKCSCGLNTPVIEKLEGRLRANIILPNGKIFPPGAFCFINPVLLKLNTFKVRQYQIIQKKLEEIEILLVIDEELEGKGPSFEKIADEIKKMYIKKTGPDVKIYVKKVDEIVNKKNKRKPAPIVISYVDYEEAVKKLEN